MKGMLPLLLVCSLQMTAQELKPDGTYQLPSRRSNCITDEQRTAIEHMLQSNTDMLIKEHLLPDANAQLKTTATKFDWPLKQAAGFSYNSYYAFTNYIDHDPAYPNKLKDWNCGIRTYDGASGTNHKGMDITPWPFGINMMDANQVEIVAAAAGTITGKEDGNFDKNCTMGTAKWNAVYLKHADGTVTWYGHMKKGSVTTKGLGATVAAGEYLGLVGSSGSTLGPHLHFEVHDAGGSVLDPYNGPCNSTASMWTTQKPYIESTINTLLTHHAPPGMADCPLADTMNVRDTFAPGQKACFAAYYHDNGTGKPTEFKIYDVTGAVFKTWSYTPTAASQVASYAYWSHTLPVSGGIGKWKFEAQYQSKTVSHDFYVLFPTSVKDIGEDESINIYPNPAKDHIMVVCKDAIDRIEILNTLGQSVFAATHFTTGKIELPAGLPNGVYVVRAEQSGLKSTFKLLVNR